MKSVMSTDENGHDEKWDVHWQEWPPWKVWCPLMRMTTMIITNKGDYTGENGLHWQGWLHWQ